MTIYHLRGTDGTEVFTGTIEPPPGSGSQPGALASAEFLFEEQATAANVSHAIIAADSVAGTFTIAGDHVAEFPGGTSGGNAAFTVTGSTGNDGTYQTTADGASLVGGDTVISVGSVPSDVGDGTISFGLYEALLPVAAGTVVETVRIYNLATWAARVGNGDKALFSMGDTLNGPLSYFGAQGSNWADFSDVYDPGNNSDHTGWESLSSDGSNIVGGYSLADPYCGQVAFYAPVGIRYAADDTLTIRLLVALAAPPVVPTGRYLVKILYFVPVDPGVVTHP